MSCAYAVTLHQQPLLQRVGDYDDPGIDVCGFTEDIATLKGVVARQVATGGGDGPEDVCGGLREALALEWTAQKRHLFLVADAPCHGERYHDAKDSYPAGDPTTPTRLVPEEQLEALMAETGKGAQVRVQKGQICFVAQLRTSQGSRWEEAGGPGPSRHPEAS